MTNTCPVDNMLMIFHCIFNQREDIFQCIESNTTKVCKVLSVVHRLFGKGHFQEGQFKWLTEV